MLKNAFRRGCLNHSLYDWISLLSNLLIPLVIGVLTIVLPLHQENLSEHQNENSKISAFNRRLKNIETLRDEQKQIILDTYQQDLTNLLLKYNDDDDNDERISLIIRTKTLHALRQLDPARKIFLIQLLIDSGIQHRINMSHTNLSSSIFPQGSIYSHLQFKNIVAQNISLIKINLYHSNFSHSILDDSVFLHSNCSHADFSYASLQRTNWNNTDVTQAIFNYTNLYKAKITNEQLVTVQSLQGAILPNGTTVTG